MPSFMKNVSYVGFDGALAQLQVCREAVVGVSFGHQGEHFVFPFGEGGPDRRPSDLACLVMPNHLFGR